MLLANLAYDLDDAAQIRSACTRGRIVWQERYNGIACVAYQNGQAIAGISGPWSDRYALIWWLPRYASPQLELFESLDAARLAVAQSAQENRSGPQRLLSRLLRSSALPQRVSWLARALAALRRRWLTRNSPSRTAAHCRLRVAQEDTDLSGMHFSAHS